MFSFFKKKKKSGLLEATAAIVNRKETMKEKNIWKKC